MTTPERAEKGEHPGWKVLGGAGPGRFIDHLRTPLYRNGYALVLSSVLSGGVGLIYWILAARYFAADVVGRNSALVSGMLLLSGLAQFSLTGALVRFIPVAGARTRRVAVFSYGVSVVASIVGGAAFTFGVGSWVPELRFLGTQHGIGVAFVAATASWSIFSLQDSILTGLGRSYVVPIENILFAIAKIVLLVAFTSLPTGFGIFASFVIPVAISLLPINWLLFRHWIPSHALLEVPGGDAVTLRDLWRYVVGNYAGSLFFVGASTLLPLVVATKLGASATAYFYQPWMIATSLQLIAANMTTALTVEVVRDPPRLGHFCYGALIGTLRLLAPTTLFVVLGAPHILRLFGAAYAIEGAGLLRLLTLATIPNVFVVLFVSLARVRNSITGVVVVQGASCVILLGLSYLFIPYLGIAAVGVASLAGQSFLATVVLVTHLWPLLKSGRLSHRLAVH